MARRLIQTAYRGSIVRPMPTLRKGRRGVVVGNIAKMLRRDLLKIIPGLAVAQAFAGAKAFAADGKFEVGINLAAVTYWTTEHAFSNLAMSASRWRLQEFNEPFSWDLPLPPMTPSGYPTIIPPNSLLESFLIFTPFRRHLSDTLLVEYDGVGRIEYTHGGELVRREPGRDIIRNLDNEWAIGAQLMSTSPDNPLRNLRLSEEHRSSQGTFRAEFLQRLGGMSVLRFMDWMDTNNSKLARWEQRPVRDRFTQVEGGVAVELMVELSNTLGISPWFTLPHLADDEFVRAFAGEVRRTLKPDIPVYVEYSNEVWNTMFDQSTYAQEQGLRLGLSSNSYEAGLRFYSQRTSEILSIWEDVFGGDSRRIIGVYAAQFANPWTSETILSWANAKDHADVLAVAPYFGGMIGHGEAAGAGQWTLDRLFDSMMSEIRSGNQELIATQAALADRFGVDLVAYEGGQHLVAQNDEALSRIFEEANRDPRMGELYGEHLNYWRRSGGGVYTFYNSMGSYSKWGSWGLAEHEGAVAGSAKWTEVRKMIGA